MSSNRPLLVVVCGPTAIGKTTTAIALAKKFDAEIISADSRQFYREMNIGTAKPTEEELAAVKHHFINHLSIHKRHYSAGIYEQEVLELLADYFKSKQIAVMVGGSGLFINAVCSGFDSFDSNNNESDWQARSETRKFLNAKSLEWLQGEVERLDPEYFAVVDKKNPVRLKRALEVIYSTGKKYSEQRIGRKSERFFDVIKIGLNTQKERLYERINLRVDLMMEQGLLDEVKELYLHRKLHALNTVGYTELFDYIEEKISLDDAVALIKQNTRQYAKRQMTWFKKDPNIHWLDPEELDVIFEFLSQRLIS
jgi:tRNA dimethylallyltransferase